MQGASGLFLFDNPIIPQTPGNGKPLCAEKDVRCDRLDNLARESVEGLFADLDRLWVNVKKAQEVELTAQDPKRAELQAVEDFIAQADREADEIALAMRQAKGRVGESLQRQQGDLNARLEGYHKRRGELIAKLGARRLTDDAIQDIMEFARDVREGLTAADFETKQRVFELLDVQVTVKDGQAQVSCMIADCMTQGGAESKSVARYYGVPHFGGTQPG